MNILRMPQNLLQKTASAALATPRIVQLKPNLFAVCLEAMKIIPAKYILEKAWREGRIDKQTLIIESSSGNFALGLAVVCNELGLQLHIVGDPAIDPGLKRILANLGARVDIIALPDALGAYQRLRLERVAELLRENTNSMWVQQYDNRYNPEAYGDLASLMLAEIGDSFELVASVGSGGSSVGLTRALRARSSTIDLTGVDTFNSILFGLPDGKRSLRGLGNSVMPQILDHTLFDRIHWLSGRQGNRAALDLHARHALFCGPTSGAAFQVARHRAAVNPGRAVVFIAPDTGYRYQDTVYDREWLRANGLYLDELVAAPTRVSRLDEVDATSDWTCIDWNRRSLEQMKHKSDLMEHVL